ncbi:beta-glucosidase 11-like isoform X3 [Benincasa hispida]|nr:beta-glucosidase 11-like isoform X3 [Benincasa hispida]XP_038905761.1 beta-glucosidase 11-like isoform X3 [Benincasa hispida]
MVDIGLDAYKFSISWSRLIPNGRGPVNPKGLEYYNNLINELITYGIQPHVTLFNFDLPQELEDEYGGWVSPKIIEDFTAYAELCFKEFGDRVLYWSTINEPNVFADGGYDLGFTPPQRCSAPFGLRNCSFGNSTTEPYLVVHHALLAHASTSALYKKNYKDKQQGFIGFNLYTTHYVPLTDSEEDANAVQRATAFLINWVLHPLVFGDYPNLMKDIVGLRMPIFTKAEKELVKGSCDFIGIIYYYRIHVKDKPPSQILETRDYHADVAVQLLSMEDERAPEVRVGSLWLPVGLQELIQYLNQVYGNLPMYIYENGLSLKRNSSLEDGQRVEYMQSHIAVVLNALRNGSNVKGYFTWSFLDVYELLSGYSTGYGLIYVDLDDPDLKRYPKLSAKWYSNFLKGKAASLDGVLQLQNNHGVQ